MPATAKEQMLEIIQNQPDDSSYEELLRELAFEQMVESGFDDADHGRTISNEEMDRRISSWANQNAAIGIRAEAAGLYGSSSTGTIASPISSTTTGT